MSLTVRVELLHGVYDAAGLDAWRAEWPPHPARVFCALLASGQEEDDVRALRWLEAQPPPRVHAAVDVLDERLQRSYVVTNRIEGKGGHQAHAGRKAIERVRASCVPTVPRWAFSWPAAEPDPDVLHTLQLLTKKVPYVGRSTATAIVTVEEMEIATDPAWVAWDPLSVADDMLADTFLRAPYAGYTAALLSTHETGGRAWEVGRERAYRQVDDRTERGEPPAAVQAPHDGLVVLGLPQGVTVPGEHAGLLTSALRKTVMSRARDPLVQTLSGHDADGRTHVAFVPLLDVGHPHARGHALGVAVLLPMGDDDARRAIGQAMDVAHGRLSLRLPSGVDLELEHRELTRSSEQLRPWTWSRPARTWATVTPIVLDRFPKENVERELVRSCEALGLPPVEDVIVSSSPLVPGAPRLLRRHLPRADRRPVVHARLTFASDVAGPLVLGAQRYLGIGLLRPQGRGIS